MTRNTTTESKQTRQTNSPAFIAWHVVERGDKAFWTRIGAAWDHKDGEGLTLQLDLMPVHDGRVVLRTPAEPAEDEGRA